MHIPARVFIAVTFAIFSAQLQASDLVSVVEENFPYEEVDQSYALAQMQQSQCLEGAPFELAQARWEANSEMDLAERIHAKLRSLGANAFVITDMKEDARVSTVVVTPLTCAAA